MKIILPIFWAKQVGKSFKVLKIFRGKFYWNSMKDKGEKKAGRDWDRKREGEREREREREGKWGSNIMREGKVVRERYGS